MPGIKSLNDTHYPQRGYKWVYRYIVSSIASICFRRVLPIVRRSDLLQFEKNMKRSQFEGHIVTSQHQIADIFRLVNTNQHNQQHDDHHHHYNY